MQKIVLFFTLIFLCFACNRSSQNEKYANLPKELGDLYQQINQSPEDADLYQKLSIYFIGTRQFDSAFNAISYALRLDSNNDNFYETLSDVYFAQTNTDAAEEALDKALAINPKNNDARLKLAELHFLLKRYKLSQEEAQQAIINNSLNPKAYLILAWNYRELGDTATAIRNYLFATEQNPDYYDAYMELGVLYHSRHDALAINYYNNALNCRPNDAQALYNLAMFYQETDNIDKALSHYKMILQNDPTNKFALHNMGWIFLVKQQKYEEAVVFFSKAIEQDETYIEAIYNRGLSFEMLEKYSNARQDYMYCLKLFDKFELAIEGLNRLDELTK